MPSSRTSSVPATGKKACRRSRRRWNAAALQIAPPPSCKVPWWPAACCDIMTTGGMFVSFRSAWYSMVAVKTRTIRLLRSPSGDEPGLFCVIDRRKEAYYVFREIPCEIGGRGFEVHRLGLGQLYHVRIGEP